MHPANATIAAIATSPQSAAIGVVKVSGPAAGAVLDLVVPGRHASRHPRTVRFGRAVHPRTFEPIDDILCFFCQGPRSATGEDVAELHGHGGAAVMAALLSACLEAGCVLAHPGEFTYRALCNGRIDLAQAEAVAALIGASSTRAARAALEQLHGGLARSVGPMVEELSSISAILEAELDFPEDETPSAGLGALARRLDALAEQVGALAHSYALGQRLREGARVALLGPVNAGKSSLLNALCAEDRAIVDAEPGTTRDIVRVTVDCGGIPVELLDTAGLRDNPDRIERHGIERTLDAAKAADLVIWVMDGTKESPLPAELEALTAPLLLAVNKADLPGFDLAFAPRLGTIEPLAVSAKTGQGVPRLKALIGENLGANQGAEESPLVGTARQHETLRRAQAHLRQGERLLADHHEPELVAHELHRARAAFGELLGTDPTEDLLGKIFATFCIGK